LLLGRALAMTAVGVALGLAAALGLTRLLASMLYGVPAHDPLTFGAVALLLVGVAFLACYLPARRAARIDAMVALKSE
jgi:putative ABC transport system permease protein